MIIGAVSDPQTRQVYLVGDGTHPEASPEPALIASALWWAFSEDPDGYFLSIDPDPESPQDRAMHIAVAPEVQDTALGWVMLESDRVLKSYGLGLDTVSNDVMRTGVPGFRSMLDRALDNDAAPSDLWSRFWLKAGSNDAQVDGPHALRLENAPIVVDTETMRLEDGHLVSAGGQRDEDADAFAQWFTQQYREVASEEPVFLELEQAYRLMLIADWIREQGVPIDIDWLARNRSFMQHMPAITPALRRTVTRTETDGSGTTTTTLEIFGGVDFRSIPYAPTSGDLGDLRDAVLAGAVDAQGKTFTVDVGGRTLVVSPVTRVEDSAPWPMSDALQVPIGSNALQLQTRPLLASEAGIATDRALALPTLRAVLPEAREGKVYYFKVGDDEIPERRYELYAPDGMFIDRFEEHVSNEEGTLLVLAKNGSGWQLQPDGADWVIAADWDGANLRKAWVFSARTGLLAAERIGDSWVHYVRNDFGTLVSIRLDSATGTELVAFENGNNGYRNLSATQVANGMRVALATPASDAGTIVGQLRDSDGELYPISFSAVSANVTGDRLPPYVIENAHWLYEALRADSRLTLRLAGGTLVVDGDRIEFVDARPKDSYRLEAALRKRGLGIGEFLDSQRAGLEDILIHRYQEKDMTDRLRIGRPSTVQEGLQNDRAYLRQQIEHTTWGRLELPTLSLLDEGDGVWVDLDGRSHTINKAAMEAFLSNPATGPPPPELLALLDGHAEVAVRRSLTELQANPARGPPLSERLAAALNTDPSVITRARLLTDPRRGAMNRQRATSVLGSKYVTTLVSGFEDDTEAQAMRDAVLDLEFAHGIANVEGMNEVSRTSNTLILISGHADAQALFVFLDAQLANAVNMNGSALVLLPTEARLTADQIHVLLRKYGLTSILQAPEPLEAAQVKSTLEAAGSATSGAGTSPFTNAEWARQLGAGWAPYDD